MADAIVGNAELGATKQDLIASAVQRELAFRAKLVPTVMDVSQFAQPGAKTIEFPKLTSFSVTKRTEGSAGDATVLTATTDVMPLDQNAYVAWIIDSKSALQSRIDAQVEYATRAASAHGRQVDLDVISELETIASLNINAGTPAAITRDDVLDMREHIKSNDALMEDALFVFSVDQEKELLKIDEFSRNDVYGSPVIQSGVVGRLFGIPVMVHNGVKDGQVLLYEKSACAIGFQQSPNFSDQGANEFGSTARRNVLDQLYGIKGMQLGEKSVGATESPLVAKLID